MSYALVPSPLAGYAGLGSGLGAVPGALAVSAARAAIAKNGGTPALQSPEAQMASTVFVSTMSNDGGSADAALNAAGASMAGIGAAAACAATGAGAALAPLCAMAGSFLYGKLAGALSSKVRPCLNMEDELAQATQAEFLGGDAGNRKMYCDGDPECEAAVMKATYEYASRRVACAPQAYGHGDEMAARMLAEAKALGIKPFDTSTFKGPLLADAGRQFAKQFVYDWSDPKWQTFAKSKFQGELTQAVLKRKRAAWLAAAKKAKAVADSEYDTLVRSCPPGIGLRRFIGTTECQRKAAQTATLIAARSYQSDVIDAAPAILAGELETLRGQFINEIKQDQAIYASANAAAESKRRLDAADRLAFSNRVKASLTKSSTKRTLGLAALCAAALGGFYLYRTQHA